MITSVSRSSQAMPGKFVNIRRFKYSSYLNERASGKIAEKPYGYSVQNKLILDSFKDMNRISNRIKLVSESGFEESMIDILCESSCFTVQYLKTLTRYKKEIENWKKNAKALKAKAIRSESDILGRISESNAEVQKNDRLYSKVTRLDTSLIISNDSPAYSVNLKVSLCICRDMIELDESRKIETADQNYIYEGIVILDGQDSAKFGIKKRNILGSDGEFLSKDSLEKSLSDDIFNNKRVKNL